MVWNQAAASPNPAGVYAVAVIMSVTATVAVAARLYVRRNKKTVLGMDDWTILVGCLLTWVLGIIMVVGAAAGGLGSHITAGQLSSQIASKAEVAYFLVQTLAFGVIKLSVILLYRRLFVGSLFKRYSMAMIVLIVLWSLAFLFSIAFQCGSDITNVWTSRENYKRYCDDTSALDLGYAVSDVITDLMVILIPLPIIWKLQMSKSQKIALTSIFLLGLLSTAAGTVRMAMVISNIYYTTFGLRDINAVITNVLVWSQVEAGVGILAACLPTLRPLFVGKSPESLIGSLRSKLSLSSVRSPKRRTSDSEILADDSTMGVETIGYSEKAFQSSVATEITGNDDVGRETTGNRIMVHSGLAFKAE